MSVTLQTKLSALSKVGNSIANRLKKLGLKNVKDLIFYYPFRYEDYSRIVNIEDIKIGETLTVHGRIAQITSSASPIQRKSIIEAQIADNTGHIKAVWFNQPFIAKTLKFGDNVALSGKVEIDRYGLQFKSPEYEKLSLYSDQIHTGRLVPVYSVTAGITQKQIRFLVKLALSVVDQIEEWLPEQISNIKCQMLNVKNLPDVQVGQIPARCSGGSNTNLKFRNHTNNNKTIEQFNNYKPYFNSQGVVLSNQFINLQEALKNIHFPENYKILEQSKYRLKFDELFLVQIRNFLTKQELKKYRAPKIEFHNKQTKQFVDSLPFQLTLAQRKTAWQILCDLDKNQPMNRLLEGDVGSGKTIVSLIAMLNCALNNYQSVLMAPTEILAHQHFITIVKLLDKMNISVGLLTRSERARTLKHKNIKTIKQFNNLIIEQYNKISKKKLIEQIAKGNVKIIIGTHSLIQENIKFKNLALAIVDEQHRFGVEQRKTLKDKTQTTKTIEQSIISDNKFSPHFLSMSATPIPRSLALTLYGDLDLSIINEMPKSRKPIITKLVDPMHRNRAYEFIKAEVKKGRQVFVICPLIEESDVLGVKAATIEYKRLKKQVFSDLKIGLLHGKLKTQDKQTVQRKFMENSINILVATSVVEVGIDVPNASVMMIEGAERFGLAQLHQFRGRVGRSIYQSYCFLFTESMGSNIRQRLNLFVKAKDGFEVAELDLKFRGAGEIFGTRQHGLPEFKLADLSDHSLIEFSQTLAREIIEKDPILFNYPKIKEKILTEGGLAHLE